MHLQILKWPQLTMFLHRAERSRAHSKQTPYCHPGSMLCIYALEDSISTKAVELTLLIRRPSAFLKTKTGHKSNTDNMHSTIDASIQAMLDTCAAARARQLGTKPHPVRLYTRHGRCAH